MKFSILDVETTGFSPRAGDRIVELSIITIDETGIVQDSYETLLNPRRDIASTKIHGIKPAMVVDAPVFEDVAANILGVIDQSVIVSHNAIFDISFLKNELERATMGVPDFNGVCTLNLSRQVVPELPSRKLEVLCTYFDIPLRHSHAAYYDCLATKDLFLKLFEIYSSRFGVENFIQNYYLKNVFRLPPKISPTPTNRVEYRRQDALDKGDTEVNRLRDMILRLPENVTVSEVPVQEYLNILDEILSDRIITIQETEKLFLLAEEFGISRARALQIHEEYLRRLVRIYLLDDILSDSEVQDLHHVSKLLQIEKKLPIITELERAVLPSMKEAVSNENPCIGKSVCFTGELCAKIKGRLVDRQFAQELAIEKGMVIKSGVSKNLDMLVVADPHTQSGKAQKAKSLEIKIVAEPVFWRMIGIDVE